jgi:hypothetical protein
MDTRATACQKISELSYIWIGLFLIPRRTGQRSGVGLSFPPGGHDLTLTSDTLVQLRPSLPKSATQAQTPE